MALTQLLTRPWVLFIAVVAYLYGFFSTLVGVYFVVEGADT